MAAAHPDRREHSRDDRCATPVSSTGCGGPERRRQSQALSSSCRAWGTDHDRAVERITRLLDHPDYQGWVAVDQTPIGFATGQLNWMLQVDAPVAELTGLAVLPEACRHGCRVRPADRV